MTVNFYRDLGWLPSAPENFRQLLRSWPDADNAVATLGFLAGHSLNLDQLNSLASQLRKALSAGVDTGQLTPYTLGIVSNSTTEHLIPAIVATGLRHNLLITVAGTPYGQVMQAAMGELKEFRDHQLDSVLCAIDARGFPMSPGLFDEGMSATAAAESIAYLQQVTEGIVTFANAPCMLQTLAPMPEAVFGSIDRRILGTNRNYVTEFNRRLDELTGNTSHLLLDIAAIAETVGTSNWHDPSLHVLAKMAFAQDMVPLYAEHICRLAAAHKGKSRRCLVLDLDNTLWGGVIGDDGVAGIRLGQGDALGEAYLMVQQTALELRQRGIVLAVSSKNDDQLAREPFREHPDMLLQEEHIAVFQANWDNKAENIVAIAEELRLGLDTFVFFDDNPAERAIVRTQLPQVAVPELPNEPALFARTLLSGGYFESVHFSEEDRQRADDYQAQTQRTLVRKSFVDMGAFLTSLEMRAHITPFQTDSLKRITQLVNKSNQFNLTTRRYTESQVTSLAKNPDIRTWQIRLEDTFGDNGLISVVVCKVNKDDWEIDTWLMSCRVLGRRVEELALREIITDARSENVKAIKGMFIPTKRNSIVENHYSSLGFSRANNKSGQLQGATCWQLDLADYNPPELPFTVSRT